MERLAKYFIIKVFCLVRNIILPTPQKTKEPANIFSLRKKLARQVINFHSDKGAGKDLAD